MPQSDKKLRTGAALIALSYLIVLVGRTHSLLARTLHESSYPPSPHGESSLALPLALATLAAVEMLVAWIPLRPGERWAFWATALPLVTLGTAKLVTDPGCTSHFFQQHGCHQFMISLVIAVAGLALCARALFSRQAAA